ncbi:fructose-bisphosphate aldolase-lysine N-methyltransferase, chloroplastic isoform X1 [Camellia sinensis]|uniref:fructose-bisphosphate aldolase-lysine N-methyltransferase, chloroplastic isoform X1 n=1 Tax=Camellia sinensis TaxID=4442 RepID=UPI001035ED72|nr:fructose-bisphosphate aldolase-lysine N-methyltransferase, chloroplastic isoform X1 [Camellia sinensis]
MLSITRIANHCWLHRPLFTLSNRPSITKLKLSTFSSVEVSCSSDEECDNFLPWLERKAGTKISSVLSIGKSAYGRSLLASKSIEPGDCMLKVPYNVQIASDNLLPEINSLLPDEVSNVATLAIVIIVEQKMGQHSEWAPFMSRLPQLGEMHNTIFWSERELDMIRQSSVYQETIKKNVQIEKNFLAVKPAFGHFPEFFDGITFDDFRHAYALVESRAWRSTRGVSLIPFADFLNHDGAAEEVVLSDEDKKLSEVIADRNYSPGDQVLIRYGKFSNATLLLDFGFTLSYNIYDEVRIQVNIPRHDPLCAKKLELLHVHCTPAIEDVNGFSSSQDSFTIKEVRSAKGKGRGIPQSLRAFARVLCSTSSQELSDLAMEAVQNDGRLARHPLKNKTRELEAHWFLLSKITRLVEEHNVSIKSLEPSSSPFMFQKFALRKQMARDLLAGELRVLKSASEWLKNYCTTLSKS